MSTDMISEIHQIIIREQEKIQIIPKNNPGKLIFNIKKYHRNGLYEKKLMKKNSSLHFGKWSKEESAKFIRAGMKYGTNWRKLKQEIGTRTHAQIRSHAQKFIIKLCKKYNIEIKSKRKAFFSLGHLNFPYRRKSVKSIVPLEKISKTDLMLIRKFDFYIKKIDLEPLESPTEELFKVEKVIKHSTYENSEIKEDLEICNEIKKWNVPSSITSSLEENYEDMRNCEEVKTCNYEIVKIENYFIERSPDLSPQTIMNQNIFNFCNQTYEMNNNVLKLLANDNYDSNSINLIWTLIETLG